MRMIVSSRLAPLAIAALLSVPGALAQSAAERGAAALPRPPPRLRRWRAIKRPAKARKSVSKSGSRSCTPSMRITSAEQPQWEEFAQIMRENARDMDQALMQRAQQFPTMNAVQNMQSYEQIAEEHTKRLQKLVPAFEKLYGIMPDQQKQLADQVFRASAKARTAERGPEWLRRQLSR